jgi:hypothetical protein
MAIGISEGELRIMIREGGIREYKIERDHPDWRLFVRPFYPGSSWLEIDAVQAPGGRWSSFKAASAFALTINTHTVATVSC